MQLRQYRLSTVTGDRYSGNFAGDAFHRGQISYPLAAVDKIQFSLDLPAS